MILNYKLLNLLSFDEFTLKPGLNDLPGLDKSRWAESQKKFPKLRHVVEEGNIEVVNENYDFGGDDESDNADAAQQLSKLKEKDALILVNQTADITLLGKWLATTKSQNVQKAIRSQIEKYEKALEPESK